jgi:hypothetical protein
VLFLPIYVTGKPSKQQDIEDNNQNTVVIALLTAINISGSKDKQLAVFVLMMLGYTTSAFFLMYLYWKKSMNWRNRKHSHQEPFFD